jgi:peptidyl-prolyl cis-trans isomerase C
MKNRKLPPRVFALVLLVASFASVGLYASTELAKVNTRVITVDEFNKKYTNNLKFFPYKPPTRKAVLDDLIKRELVIQEAKKAGLDKDPEVIDQMNTVLYQAQVAKRLGAEWEKIHIEDDEAKRWYGNSPELRTSHIFVAVAPNAKASDEKEALEQIRKLQQEVKAGKTGFAEIAQRSSQGPAAPMGGDIDFQPKDMPDPAYYAAAKKLRVGQVSDVVRTQFGFHLIRLTAIKNWDDADKPAVKRRIHEEKRAQIFERYVTQLRGQSKVTVNSALLKD